MVLRKPLLVVRASKAAGTSSTGSGVKEKEKLGNKGFLLSVTGDAGTVNMDKAEALDPFFALLGSSRPLAL